jgi:hypothetical protein
MLNRPVKTQQFVFGVLGDTLNSQACMLTQACAAP